MTPGRVRAWMAREAEDSSPRDIERCLVLGLWIAFASALLGFIALAVEPTWHHALSSAGDIGLILLIALAGAGWDRAAKLEDQRSVLLRTVNTLQSRLGAEQRVTEMLRGNLCTCRNDPSPGDFRRPAPRRLTNR